MRRYGSFLVRWWQTEQAQQRVSIRHVQTDEELTVAALPDAFAWMASRMAVPQRAPPGETTPSAVAAPPETTGYGGEP